MPSASGQEHHHQPSAALPLTLPPLNYATLRQLSGRRRNYHRAHRAAGAAGTLGPVDEPGLGQHNFSVLWSTSSSVRPLPHISSPLEKRQALDQRAWRATLRRAALSWDPVAPPAISTLRLIKHASYDDAPHQPPEGPADLDQALTATPSPVVNDTEDTADPMNIETNQSAAAIEVRSAGDASSLLRLLHSLPPALAPAVLSYLEGDLLWASLFAVAVEAAALEAANLAKASARHEAHLGAHLGAHLRAQLGGAPPSWNFLTAAVTGLLEVPGEAPCDDSLWPSFDSEWTSFIAAHRVAHEDKMNSGDLSVDVECSAWPDAMGDVEHEAPVWVRDPSRDAGWQAERRAHDESLRVEHRRLLAHQLELLGACLAAAVVGATAVSAAVLGGLWDAPGGAGSGSRGGSRHDGGGDDNDDDDDNGGGGGNEHGDDDYFGDSGGGGDDAGRSLVSLAPLVVFGGGAVAVQCALEAIAAAVARRAALVGGLSQAHDAPASGSGSCGGFGASGPARGLGTRGHSEQRGTRLRRGLCRAARSTAGPSRFGLCLSGLGDRVPGSLLAATVLSPCVAAALVRLDLRGLILTLSTPRDGTARATGAGGGGADDDEVEGCQGDAARKRPAARHPLSVRFGRGGEDQGAAAAAAAAEAWAEASAARLMGALGEGCSCLRRLDLSGLLFRLEERALVTTTTTMTTTRTASTAATTTTTTQQLENGAPEVVATVPAAALTVGLSDGSLGALAAGLARHGSIRKLALGGANQVSGVTCYHSAAQHVKGSPFRPVPMFLAHVSCRAIILPVRLSLSLSLSVLLHCQLSDAGLRRLGECVGQSLTDLSLYSCYRVGDIGIMHVAKPNLLRINYCGCYKVILYSRQLLALADRRHSVLCLTGGTVFSVCSIPHCKADC